MSFANQHFYRWAGASYKGRDEVSYYAVEYGALRSVYAPQACNYSYREFWF
jgi:hypothetical protein